MCLYAWKLFYNTEARWKIAFNLFNPVAAVVFSDNQIFGQYVGTPTV